MWMVRGRRRCYVLMVVVVVGVPVLKDSGYKPVEKKGLVGACGVVWPMKILLLWLLMSRVSLVVWVRFS